LGIKWRKRRGFLPEKTVAALPWLEKPRAERENNKLTRREQTTQVYPSACFQLTSLSQFEVYLGEAATFQSNRTVNHSVRAFPFAAAAVLSYLGCC
jgi:hypothetical protein